jgi:hypothetical protein
VRTVRRCADIDSLDGLDIIGEPVTKPYHRAGARDAIPSAEPFGPALRKVKRVTAELAIYISAAPEMDPECELLGQRLALLTQSARWTIKRTPTSGEYTNPDLDTLARSQFYLILLGQDIVAPMGVEWRAAQAQGLAVLAYRSTARPPTPAASVFAHQSGIEWRVYASPQQFAHDVERRLIRMLIEGTPGYGLAWQDVEQLAERLRENEEPEQSEKTGESRRGAGQGGIILPSSQG